MRLLLNIDKFIPLVHQIEIRYILVIQVIKILKDINTLCIFMRMYNMFLLSFTFEESLVNGQLGKNTI